jgi:hypothetical protein
VRRGFSRCGRNGDLLPLCFPSILETKRSYGAKYAEMSKINCVKPAGDGMAVAAAKAIATSSSVDTLSFLIRPLSIVCAV